MNLLRSDNRVVASAFSAALLAALFYTGTNTWWFSVSYLFLTTVLVVVLLQRYRLPLSVPLTGVVLTSVVLLLWFAIAIFLNPVKYLSLYNLFWVGSLFLVFLLFTFYQQQQEVWFAVWPAVLLLIALWAIYGLVQHYYFHTSANATFLNRNSLAALVNLAIVPASGYFLLAEKQRPWLLLNNTRLGLILFILFSVIFVIASRGASLSLLFALVLLFVLSYRQQLPRQRYLLFGIIASAFVLVALSQHYLGLSGTAFTERMASIQHTEQAGHSRFILWQSLLPLFEQMPWYGIGLGSLWLFWPPYRPAADTSSGFFAHNDYLQLTLEAGYPGIVLLLGLFVFVLLLFLRGLKQHDNQSTKRIELIGLFSALLAFAMHSFFTYNFYILPLSLIAGFYLARFHSLATVNMAARTIPAIRHYFSPLLYRISVAGVVLLLAGYFISFSLSGYYNTQGKLLTRHHEYKAANLAFLKAQKWAPMMDSPYFNHADLMRHAAEQLDKAGKPQQAQLLRDLAFRHLLAAEQRNPLRPQTRHIRGLLYLPQQPQQAIAEFEQALQRDPRFLFSRIQLARYYHDHNKLTQALQVLEQGVNYTYPVNKVMLDYMRLFADYAHEAGATVEAQQLENNLQRLERMLKNVSS